MLLVDATTGEHARGIGTVVRGVLGGFEFLNSTRTVVAAGPTMDAPANLRVRRISLARTRPGRLVYQRLLLPHDLGRIVTDQDRIDRVLLLDAYTPLVRGKASVRYGAFVHDTLPLSQPAYWPFAKRLIKRSAFWSLRHNAACLFTSTEFNARELRRLIGKDARVVRFGCGQLTDEEADSALAAPLPGRGAYVVYVGAFEPRKLLVTLIDAFEQLVAVTDRAVRLVIAGGGHPDYLDLLRARISRLPEGLIDVVVNPSRAAALRLIKEASALALPSSAEGFGLPVLEALALGTPVVASDLEAIRDWAGESVRYAMPDRPAEWVEPLMAALSADDHERRQGQYFARDFRWRTCAGQLADF